MMGVPHMPRQNAADTGTFWREQSEVSTTAAQARVMDSPRAARAAQRAAAAPIAQIIADASERSTLRSAIKVSLWLASMVGLIALILALEHWLPILFAQLLLGLAFAHGVELSHEALHHNMVRQRWANRLVGRIVAAPLLVSFTQYRQQHLHHHRYVGTPEDRELFDYDKSLLETPRSFISRAFNIARIPTFLRTYAGMLRGQWPEVIDTPQLRRDFFLEYTALLLLFVVAVGATLTGATSAFLLAWFIPWLVFGELFHFLFELPEHLGRDKLDRDRVVNTRSYRCPDWLGYVLNGNNFHVEHHLYPRVAVHRLAEVNAALDAARHHTLRSYRAALAEAVSGEAQAHREAGGRPA